MFLLLCLNIDPDSSCEDQIQSQTLSNQVTHVTTRSSPKILDHMAWPHAYRPNQFHESPLNKEYSSLDLLLSLAAA